MNVKLKVLILVMIFVNSIGVAYLLLEITELWEVLTDIMYKFMSEFRIWW